MAITMGLFRAAGAACVLAAMAVPAPAQSTSQNGNRAVTGSVPAAQERDNRARKQTTNQTQKKPAPRAAAAPRPIAPATTIGASSGQSWSIEHALPGRPASQTRDVPQISSPNLGRVPLDTGSFGIETKSQFKQNEFSDGRTIPGLETTKRQEPSYFGLSLQVPTNNVPLLPLLSGPRPNH